MRLEPNVIFIRQFLYKKHCITEINPNNKHASMYSAAARNPPTAQPFIVVL